EELATLRCFHDYDLTPPNAADAPSEATTKKATAIVIMYFITALLPQAMSCHFTGWCIVLTIKSQSSSSLPIPLFMRGYGLRSMDWMKASSPMTLSGAPQSGTISNFGSQSEMGLR